MQLVPAMEKSKCVKKERYMIPLNQPMICCCCCCCAENLLVVVVVVVVAIKRGDRMTLKTYT